MQTWKRVAASVEADERLIGAFIAAVGMGGCLIRKYFHPAFQAAFTFRASREFYLKSKRRAIWFAESRRGEDFPIGYQRLLLDIVRELQSRWISAGSTDGHEARSKRDSAGAYVPLVCISGNWQPAFTTTGNYLFVIAAYVHAHSIMRVACGTYVPWSRKGVRDGGYNAVSRSTSLSMATLAP